MRRYLYIFVALLAIVGCKRNSVVEPTISVEQSEIRLSFEAQDVTLAVESNVALEVNVTADWLSVVSVEDGKKGSVVLHIDENDAHESRSAEVEIIAGDKSHTVAIRQEGMPERMRLKIGHTGTTLASPTWQSSESVSGTISWGDGSTDEYSEGISHDYSEGGSHTATFEMFGPTGFHIEQLNETSYLEIAY